MLGHKNKRGLTRKPFRFGKESRAQHCQTKRYEWAKNNVELSIEQLNKDLWSWGLAFKRRNLSYIIVFGEAVYEYLSIEHDDDVEVFIGELDTEFKTLGDKKIDLYDYEGFFLYRRFKMQTKTLYSFEDCCLLELSDVSKLELTGKVVHAGDDWGYIDLDHDNGGARIHFKYTDLAPSFQGKITEETPVKFNITVEDGRKLYCVNIRPL